MSITKTLGTTKRPWARGFRQFVAWSGEHPLLCAAVFFVLASALRLLFNSLLGPNVIAIHPDEYRYLHLARSIAEGGPLLIQGVSTNYQKILYPLLISPIFSLIGNPVTQIKTIWIINCLSMASVVFPVALLVRKLTPKPKILLLTLAFTVALPDFWLTVMLTSEPLYWPLVLWMFYFFHRAMTEKEQRKRLLLFVLLGLVTYLAYLTKEVAAAFVIAAAAVLIIEGIRDRRLFAQKALDLALYACAFFVAFLALKLTLFKNMGNSYSNSINGWDQLGLSALAAPGAFGYMLYSAAALLMAAILSFYILPVILPLLGFGTMNEEKRRMYLFSAFSLLITVGAIAYTVSIRETPGDRMPRWHMRLLSPMVIPFMILCFDFLFSKKSKSKKLGKMPILILTATFCVLLIILLPTVPTQDDQVDHASLTTAYLTRILTIFGMNETSANRIWMTFLVFMLAMAVAGILLFLKGKKRTILVMLLCTIVAVSMLDNFASYPTYRFLKQANWRQFNNQFHLDYRSNLESGKSFSAAVDYLCYGEISQEPNRLANATASVNAFFDSCAMFPDDVIILCMDISYADYFNTYASQTLRSHFISSYDLQAYLKEESRSELVFDDSDDYKGQRVHYIVVIDDYNPFTNVEVAYEQAPFLVLRNLDPTRLCFLDSQA